MDNFFKGITQSFFKRVKEHFNGNIFLSMGTMPSTKKEKVCKDCGCEWHKIADGDLPKVSCYIIAVYDVDDYTEGISRFIHEVFYDAEQKNFSDAYKDELNVIAWKELPKYEEE